MDISAWIGPAATAAVVSAIVTVFANHRKQSLDYITAERSPWRLRIKAAVQKLIGAFGNPKGTELALQEIKSELNPYGKFTPLQTPATASPDHKTNTVKKNAQKKKAQKKKEEQIDNKVYYLRDGHIWDAISNYEAAPDDRHSLERLITFLELMLKYDWERSKLEVSGKYFLISPILLTLLGCFTLGSSLSLPLSLQALPRWIGIVFSSFLFIFLPPKLLFSISKPKLLAEITTSIFVALPAFISFVLLFFSRNPSYPLPALTYYLACIFSIFTFGTHQKERIYINMVENAFLKYHDTIQVSKETNVVATEPTTDKE